MNNADTTLPMATPPLSSTPDSRLHETQIKQGAFEPPVVPGTLGKLERFDILRLLGEGGMGQVYLAREPLTDTWVAVKIMRPELAGDPQSVHRFLTEARHMYRLSHPRILRVLEVSDRKGGPYYVMPFIEGGSLLGQYSPERPLPPERTLAVARQIAEALAHAHSHGIIHRDLKPGNVLLDKDGNAYLTDFGLVRTVFNDSMVDASSSHLEGTAPYMSPAVARGEAEDTRCDIYAFGALLYELLAGQPPYTGRTPQLVLDQVLKGPPSPLRTANPKASPGLVKIAEGCLARELRDRYATMADVAADLERVAVGKTPLGPHGRQRYFLPRVVVLLGVTAIASCLIIFATHRGAFVASSSARSALSNVKQSDSPTLNQNEDLVPEDGRSSNQGSSLSSGLIAWWRADGDASDAQGVHHGTMSHVAFEEGENGKAFRFTGSPQSFVTIPKDPSLAIGNRDFTITLWTKLHSTKGTQVFLGSDDGSGDCNKWIFWLHNGRVQFHVNETKVGARILNGGQLTSDNQWHHLAVVNDRQTYRFYMDGKEVGAEQWSGNIPSTAGPLTLGKAEGFNFDGWLDDIRIYSRALTSFEMGTLAHMQGSFAYRPGTKGRGPTFGGRPTAVWDDAGVDLPGYGLERRDEEAPAASKAATGPTGKTQGPFTYTATNGAVTITKYIGPGGEVTIPSVIDGLPVTELAPWAFDGCGNVKGLTIPENVTSISGLFFGFSGGSGCNSVMVDAANPVYCSSADGVIFSKDKTRLVKCLASKVGSYMIPQGVTNIEAWAFHGCNALTDITIPSSVRGVGDYAFGHCSSITNITIRPGVTQVGASAFYYCTALSTATIPASVTSIGDNPFRCCSKLITIKVDEANPSFCNSEDGVLFDKRKNDLVMCPPGKVGAYVIPDGVTCIKHGAFRGCGKLTKIELPNCLKNIEAMAFRGCSGLAQMTVPASVTTIGDIAFSCDDNLEGVYFKGDAPRFAKNLFEENKIVTVYYRPGTKGWGKEFGGRPTAVWDDAGTGLPKGEIKIEDEEASAASMVENRPTGKTQGPFTYTVTNGAVTITKYTGLDGDVVVPGQMDGLPVTTIKESAFLKCAPTHVTLPNSITRIERYAFAGCSNLLTVTLPNCVTQIGHWAFCETKLSRITLPFSLRSMGYNPFNRCSCLEMIEVEDANPSFCSVDGVLYNKDKTSLVVYPCGRRGPFVVPDSVSYIANGSFHGNVALTGITIPHGVRIISPWTFKECSMLTDVALPDSITEIGADAFRSCPKLVSIEIPSAVEKIDNCAFSDCSNLQVICFKGNAATLGQRVFDGISKDAVVYYRPGTKGWGPTFGGRPTAVWNGDAPAQLAPADGGLYMVVDLSGGTNATHYPVTRLDAVPPGGWLDEYKTDKLVLRRIEPGTFLMGSPDDELARDPSREAQHLVTLTAPFYIGVFEVTQRQWELVMGTRPSYFNNPACYASRPVECVSYAMIGGGSPNDTFTGHLRARTGLSLGLPSDAQWEYACRAGTATSFDNGRNLSAVNAVCPELAAIARYGRNSGALEENGCARDVGTNRGTAAVGSYAPNEWGLYDMHGNVYEWTEDWWTPCTNSAALTDPKGPVDGRCKTVRGGSWNAEGTHCRAAARPGSRNLTNASNTFGFRVFVPAATAGEPAAATSGGVSFEPIPFTYATNSGAIVLTKYIGQGGDVETPSTVDGLPVTAIGDKRVESSALFEHAIINGDLVIKRYTGSGGDLVMPESIDGKAVTAIMPGAFSKCAGLRSVILPKSTACIYRGAFDYCNALTAVRFPDALKKIGDLAFGITGLTAVTIPAGVTELDGNPFGFCRSLTSIDVSGGNSVFKSVDGVVFDKQMSRLVCFPSGRGGTYAIPQGVKDISFAFMGSDRITHVTIPDSVTSIGNRAFDACSGLTSISIPNTVTTIDFQAFSCCFKLKSITLPVCLVNIGRNAFSQCDELTSIIIPEHVSRIDVTAFRNCPKLTALYFCGKPPMLTGNAGVFYRGDRLTIYYRPDVEGWGPTFGGRPTAVWDKKAVGVLGNDDKLDNDETSSDSMKRASETSRIHGSFVYTITNNTATIVKYTGSDMQAVIPSEIDGFPVTTIFDYAFKDCNGLTGVTIPNSINNIGNFAFSGCAELTRVRIPASVTTIHWAPFAWCSNLVLIAVDENNPAYCDMDGVLLNKEKTFLLNYPAGRAGEYKVPGSVGQLGCSAFMGAHKLTAVDLPDYPNLLPNGSVFYGCYSLVKVTLPSRLTRIGSYLFTDCTSLTNLVIPAGVKTTGRACMRRCPNLTAVCFEGNAPLLDDGSIFAGSEHVVVYYRPGTKGWGPTFGGRPTAVWNGDAPAQPTPTDGGLTDLRRAADGG